MASKESGLYSLLSWTISDESPVAKWIDQSGFGWFRKMKKWKVSTALLSALADTFDADTYTFLIKDQKYMISLEDVIYLTSLNVDGLSISPKGEDMKELCTELLGDCPPLEGRRKSVVRIDWLKAKFMDVGDNPTEERIKQCARAYILFVIGVFVISDTTSGSVELIYLEFLRDFDKVKTFSWGSAMLAHLLSYLAKYSRKKSNIYGNLVFFQFWAYEHFPVLRPDNTKLDDADRKAPLLIYWTQRCNKFSQNVHKLKKKADFTNLLQDINPPDAISPYADVVGLPNDLKRQLKLKLCHTTLICVAKHVWHNPHLCEHQFGKLTNKKSVEVVSLRNTKERSGPQKASNWAKELVEWIAIWDNRSQRCFASSCDQDVEENQDVEEATMNTFVQPSEQTGNPTHFPSLVIDDVQIMNYDNSSDQNVEKFTTNAFVDSTHSLSSFDDEHAMDYNHSSSNQDVEVPTMNAVVDPIEQTGNPTNSLSPLDDNILIDMDSQSFGVEDFMEAELTEAQNEESIGMDFSEDYTENAVLSLSLALRRGRRTKVRPSKYEGCLVSYSGRGKFVGKN